MTSANPVKVEADLESASASRTPLLVSLVQLTKPGVGGLVMVTALAGALSAPGPRSTPKLLIALIGTALRGRRGEHAQHVHRAPERRAHDAHADATVADGPRDARGRADLRHRARDARAAALVVAR